MGIHVFLCAIFLGALLLCAAGPVRAWASAPGGARPDARWRFLTLGVGLLLAAFALRLLLGYYTEGYSTDIDTFKSWGRIANQVGYGELYQQDIFLDYPPGYIYVLSFLDRLRRLLRWTDTSQWYTLLMKMPSILADLACGGALLWLGRKKLGERGALLLAGAYLFCPAVLVNSAQWGQADSFCTAILLASLALLYKGRYAASGALYGLAVISKPQMLIFAPVYLFCTARRKKWTGLGIGVACALGALLLAALPFTKDFNFLWLVDKYRATLDYYDYYSINAYNFWALIGWNWRGLPPEGLGKACLTLSAPVLATLACGAVALRSKREDALFACPAVLMSTMYLFSIKMHERYLFPMFLFILIAFAFQKDRRLIWAYGAVTAVSFLNVSHVLWLFHTVGGSYDPNDPIIRGMALVQAGAILYFLYVCFSSYVLGRAPAAKAPARKKPAPGPAGGRAAPGWQFPEKRNMRRADWLCMAAVTLAYALVGFWDLGGMSAPVTAWAPAEGEQAVIQVQGQGDALCYMAGIAPDDSRYAARTSSALRVEVSQDGVNWTDCGRLPEDYVFSWRQFALPTPGRYVRLTATDNRVALNEVGVAANGVLLPATAQGPGAEALTDEQDTVALHSTYQNSTYFDEIYHARTAYEHIQGLEPYENTHPPLGKYIISLGIRLFGMNPFGWRCMGALFGVLMLPVFYFLCKQLFGKTWLCAMGTLLFAFDFMHFTQTRIATIDTYAVFFLLLMYSCMAVFLRRDLLGDSWPKLLAPLGLSGLFMGLGVASKWTCAYGAIGLAALYFGKLAVEILQMKKSGADTAPLLRRCARLCGWCCLFFVAIPFAVYYCAYLPITTLPHNAGDAWGAFWRYQENMFHYHSQLQAEHYFASPWYEWPLDVRPIWYFSGGGDGWYSTISAMGNPLLWWAGLLCVPVSLYLFIRKRMVSCGALLAGYLSVYVPWMLVPRLTFIYHYFTAVPFLVLALLAVADWLGGLRPFAGGIRLGAGKNQEAGGPVVSLPVMPTALLVFCGACLVLFLLFYPVISGAPTTREYADSLEWLGTWYFG